MKRHADALWVAGAALIAYVNNLSNGFTYDDRFVVALNPLVQRVDLRGLITQPYWGDIVDAGLYRPLTSFTFGVNRLFGESAFSFHLVNDLLHAGASALVVVAARNLGASRFVSVTAGLVFALHPLQTEAVDSIVGRAEILALMGTLGALVLFQRGSKSVWVGILFFLALCSKESAAFALPLFLLYWLSFERRSLMPIAAAVIAYAALRFAALGGFGISGREIAFLDNPVAHADVATRVSMAFVLIGKYASLIVWPAPLSADYSYNAIPVETDWRVLVGLAVASALAWLAWRRRGLAAFAALAFLIPLTGFLHLLFPLGTLLAERLVYLPMFGMALLIALATDALPRARWVLAILLVACAARVVDRNRDWRDNETLFRQTVRTMPESARAHFLLGAELLEQDRFEEAATSFETGLAILPTHTGARMSLGEAHLGAGEPEAAMRAFEGVLESTGSADARARATEAALDAGRMRAQNEEWSLARGHFTRALELSPESVDARNMLGLVAERRGELTEAGRWYEDALRKEPDDVPALLNLASVRSNSGDLGGAEALYRRAISLAPDAYEAYNGLGIALARGGRTGDAEAAFRRAYAIDPSLGAAVDNLRALGKTP